MMPVPFQTGFSRPTQLPGDRYLGDEHDELDAILAKSDDELTEFDFAELFSFVMAASAYSGVAYFLPFAFGFMRDKPEQSLQFMRKVISFVAEYSDQLEADGILEKCHASIRQLFDAWASKFAVIHLGRSDMERIGSPREYSDWVENSLPLFGLLECLGERDSLVELADRLVVSLIDEPLLWTRSAWFIELAVKVRTGFCEFATEASDALLFDDALCQVHIELIRQGNATAMIPETYWKDALAALGVEL